MYSIHIPLITLLLPGDRKLIYWDLTTYQPLQTIPSEHGDYISISYSAPYLIACTARHITVYKQAGNALAQVSEVTLDQTLVAVAASPTEVVVLSNTPEIASYMFRGGVISERTVVAENGGKALDLSEIVCSHLPDKKKSVDTVGFKEYFERKKRRIEEETLKEEMKSARVS